MFAVLRARTKTGGSQQKVIADESRPPLRSWAWKPSQVARNGCFGHGEPDLKQLTMNARRAPQQVYPRHMGDEVANLGVHARPSAPPAAIMPASKDKPEALPAPLENRPRLNNDQGVSPARPSTGQNQPEQPVPRTQPRSTGPRPLENADLVL